jgi:cysteine desulfuration protein SufE
MINYPEKLQEIIDDFEWVTDRRERTDMLIYYADQFVEVPERVATRPFPEDHRVQYCESDAYVWVEQQPDKTLRFHFAVENPQGLSAKAMAAILEQTINGLSPEEVAKISPDVVFTLFGKDISMGKGQGLTAMISQVKTYAEQFVEN